MDEFIAGVRAFQKGLFLEQRELYQELATGQNPKALFIACSDSRVVPNELTQTSPGDLFIVRNPGNLVPVYGEHSGGVSASLEYAVGILKVPRIIICGHSDCGAMKAALQPEGLEPFPAVRKWLAYAAKPDAHGDFDLQTLKRITQGNILLQMEHALTHPSVQAAIAEGRLTIHGWLFDIGTGKIEAADPASRNFRAWPD